MNFKRIIAPGIAVMILSILTTIVMSHYEDDLLLQMTIFLIGLVAFILILYATSKTRVNKEFTDSEITNLSLVFQVAIIVTLDFNFAIRLLIMLVVQVVILIISRVLFNIVPPQNKRNK